MKRLVVVLLVAIAAASQGAEVGTLDSRIQNLKSLKRDLREQLSRVESELDSLENARLLSLARSGFQAKTITDVLLLDKIGSAGRELKEIPEGRTVRLTGLQSNWWQVEYAGASGYVPTAFVTPNDEALSYFGSGTSLGRNTRRTSPAAARQMMGEGSAGKAASDTLTVYVTSRGKKYHRAGCRYLSKSKIEKPLPEVAGRYEPCGVCDPPKIDSFDSMQGAPKAKTQTSGRCQATTKKGTQCKRKAKSGSDYCWQHGR